ncbi:hypothetical protein [Tsukamurella sp. 1534]|uniref:hypothetical protein n=1 Tax=Tsukamurella sp. 1534 TaxID=1151061 RepID=UPI0003131D79|nr:hypothetical protein [Tsukamurella sp. 1534]
MNTGRIVAAATGVLGLLGLGLTFLPILTLRFDQRTLYSLSPLSWLYGTGGGNMVCELLPEECTDKGRITVALGFLDISGLTSVPAVGLVPITMVLAAATGLLKAWRGVHRNGTAVIALLSLVALAAAAFTAFGPAPRITRTGDFAVFGGSAGSAPGLDVSPGAGLVGAAIVLVLILGLTAWQAIAGVISRR